jgi:sugar/nucleoside kinase (ribokinase family)
LRSRAAGGKPKRRAGALVVGTGGIGTGVIYRLEGNATLGREESRPAERMPGRDFCKLHIILHYVARLLPQVGVRALVCPVGAVGDDAEGREMRRLMRAEGMDLDFVRTVKGGHTLFSVCFQYPGGEGGNLTEKKGASRLVSAGQVGRAESRLKSAGTQAVVLAAPEVPLAARHRLLMLGRRHGAYNTASFVADEMRGLEPAQLRRIDLLSVNREEAAALARVSPRRAPRSVVRACLKRLAAAGAGARVVVTCGREGLFACEGGKAERLPALRVRAASTAGAGDAFLSGMIAGHAMGMPFLEGGGASCVTLGRLLAAMTVTSPDTIHFGVSARSLRAFARRTGQGALARGLRGAR